MNMKFFVFSLALLLCLQLTQCWFFGGGSSGSSGSGADRKSSWDKVKEYAGKKYDYAKQYAGGVKDMGKSYLDMRRANWKNSDKYFHARGNSDAAKRGQGGSDAARHISNAREWVDQNIKRDSAASSAADQEANRHGRNGGNLDKYRPKGLPKKY